jgi:hypothetical protein
VGISRFVAGLLLDDDSRRFLAKLRRERQQEPRVWAARLACALGVALAGFGTGYWLIALVLAAIVLAGKRAHRLASGCVVGLLVASTLLIAEVATGANPYVALFLFGAATALFALGIVLTLTAGVRFFGRSLMLRRLRREHDVEGLIALLADPDPVRRAKAADALAPLADPRTEHPLLRALADPDLDVRANAARALGVPRSEEAVDQLLNDLRDSESDVRHAAAWALGQIGDSRAIEPLRRLVADQDDGVQDGARDALQSLGATATGADA